MIILKSAFGVYGAMLAAIIMFHVTSQLARQFAAKRGWIEINYRGSGVY